ncbi:MAG: carboxypeptidase regulatory-like domain-containing protein [Planctomycetales bacterium]|nr:carboxypeptidase regulatory-like domain-containing protein [Planctomycetales bacterium]
MVCLLGCGEPQRGPKLVPASGSITYQGEPVEGATIVFLPQDHGFAAVTTSDDEGNFSLRTPQASPSDGAAPGAYKVTIRKNYMTPEDREIWLLPKPYGHVQTSGLIADVATDQDNHYAFKLVD